MASECMECVEGRAVALGLCSHCLVGEPVEAVVGQIARLARELEEARERERGYREALTEYGEHKRDCRARGFFAGPRRPPCSCGLAAALATPQEASE